MSVDDAVADGAGVPFDAERQVRLDRYLALLLAQTATLNLTAARTPASLADHVRDALSIAPYLREPFVDVGSGGGFPAIPLAIATGFRGVLVESVLKKARFLERIVRELELPLDVRAVRAEDAGRDPALRERFASATARAVSSLPAVLEFCLPLLAVGGIAVLQRGRLEPRERAAGGDAALVLGGAVESEVVLHAYDDRRVVLVRKVRGIGQRFPRRAGVPAKRPLCYDARDDD